jgi:hypothetical protein
VLEAVFIVLEFPSPSRRIFIGSHSLPPLWFDVSVLQNLREQALKQENLNLVVKVFKVEGPACKRKETRGFFRKNGGGQLC